MEHDSPRPPRTATELRRHLESIHRNVPQPLPGPHATPKPTRSNIELRRFLESIQSTAPRRPVDSEHKPERIATAAKRPRDARWCRRTLLDNSATVGGIAGTALGANTAATLFCLPDTNAMVLPIALWAATLAGVVGVLVAWRVIIVRRPDLFVRTFAS